MQHSSGRVDTSMDLSIIIVNYKKFMLTEQCINSVLENVKNLRYEIIVIDNNSPNESYSYLYDKYKDVEKIKIIRNDSNSGFGAANNLGVKHSNSKYILLLNPDVIVLKEAIEQMYEELLKNAKAGIVASKLLNKDMTLQYSCRRFLSFTEFLLARTPIKKMASKKLVKKLNDKYLMKDYDHLEKKYVDWVMGSCILCRKDDFIKVGGFSKEYFMYFEDVDLCYKIEQLDKKVLYYPKAEMIHLHSQDSIKKVNKLTFIHLSSMIKFYKKIKRDKGLIFQLKGEVY